MERDDLEHLIRAAAEVTFEYEFIIVGSQAVLGSVPNPPAELKASMEADMYPRHDPSKSDLIEGVLGEGSPFHETHGYYAQGVGPDTAVLPDGWQQRLHLVQSAGTDLKAGLCISVIDLFMSKAHAGRDKDREFCIALLKHGYVTVDEAVAVVPTMPIDEKRRSDLRARIRRWARTLQDGGESRSVT